MPSDALHEYALRVAAQLRWKRARPRVEREIEAHLRDQSAALQRGGLPAAEADAASIRQMGDAVEIGTQLDRVHCPKPAWSVLALTGVLCLCGLALKLFVTYDSDAPHELPRLLLSLALGFGCLLGAYFLDFTLLGAHPLPVYLGTLAPVAVPALRGSGVVRVYAAQLSILLPLGYAALVYRLRGRGQLGLLLALAALLLQSFCCLLIPSSTGLCITLLGGLTVLALNLRQDGFGLGRPHSRAAFALFSAVCAVAAVCFLRHTGRLGALLHPEQNAQGAGFLPLAIRELLSGARFLGQGETGPLTGQHTFLSLASDYTLTLLIHRFGWIVLPCVLLLFGAFFFFLLRKLLRQRGLLGRLIGGAVSASLLLQTLLFLTANLGFPLFAPLTLPLVSYGNTSLLANLLQIGLLLSVFRMGTLGQDEPLPHGRKYARRLHWQDGVLTIRFRGTAE